MLVEQITLMDKLYTEKKGKISDNMEKLSNFVAKGFLLFKTLLSMPSSAPPYKPVQPVPLLYFPGSHTFGFGNTLLSPSYSGSTSSNGSSPQSPYDASGGLTGIWTSD
uniref:Uncharacterized protein n=1 Tax=Amphimedon queenslandica TaxID=400682 RepID=A0A1X7TTI0_AMPQE